MGLLGVPYEIFEMIVGEVSFVDLPYFLQSAKCLQVAPLFSLPPSRAHSPQTRFNTTKYFAPLKFAKTIGLSGGYEDNLEEMHSMMSKYPKMWGSWSTDNVLAALTEQRCHEVNAYSEEL
jgi:hypothetical protein